MIRPEWQSDFVRICSESSFSEAITEEAIAWLGHKLSKADLSDHVLIGLAQNERHKLSKADLSDHVLIGLAQNERHKLSKADLSDHVLIGLAQNERNKLEET